MWFVFGFIVILFLFNLIGHICRKSLNSNSEYKNAILIEPELKYLGGFDIEGGKNSSLIIYRDRLVFVINNKRKILQIDDVIKAEIKSEIELKTDFAKFLAMGLFALFTSKKEYVRNYISLFFKDELGNERMAILNSSNNEKIVEIIKSTKLNSIQV